MRFLLPPHLPPAAAIAFAVLAGACITFEEPPPERAANWPAAPPQSPKEPASSNDPPPTAAAPSAAPTAPPPTPSQTASGRPPPPSGQDPNAPPQLNRHDPEPGIDRAIPTRRSDGIPPSNALHQNSLQDPPAPQPDPGPAPGRPTPVTAGCDPGMVRVEVADGPLCVHQYEVSVQLREERLGLIRQFLNQPSLLKLVSAPGQYPSIMSWNEATRLCAHFGYRLCTSDEWADICDGIPGEGGHPYSVISDPDSYRPGACVYTHTQHGGMVPLQKSGSKPWCVTPTGVYDLLGNVWEWTDPGRPSEGGAPVTDKRGGAHYSRDLATCSHHSVGTHGPDWLGSVGFRCCAEPD